MTLTLSENSHGIGVDATTVAVHGAWLAYGPAWVIETISMDASGARSAAVLPHGISPVEQQISSLEQVP
ncbi:MAG: hypothetical protein R2848_01550 [Thermomicrobiales bacterium]